MQDSTEGLLMEGMRQLDEYNVQIEKLPPLSTSLSIPRPLEPKLRELTPEELDVFQAALEGDTTIARPVRSIAADRPDAGREAQGAARQGLRRHALRRRALGGGHQLDRRVRPVASSRRRPRAHSASTSASL